MNSRHVPSIHKVVGEATSLGPSSRLGTSPVGLSHDYATAAVSAVTCFTIEMSSSKGAPFETNPFVGPNSGSQMPDKLPDTTIIGTGKCILLIWKSHFVAIHLRHVIIQNNQLNQFPPEQRKAVSSVGGRKDIEAATEGSPVLTATARDYRRYTQQAFDVKLCRVRQNNIASTCGDQSSQSEVSLRFTSAERKYAI